MFFKQINLLLFLCRNICLIILLLSKRSYARVRKMHHQSFKSAKKGSQSHVIFHFFHLFMQQRRIKDSAKDGGPTYDLFDKEKFVIDILLFTLLTSWTMICFGLCMLPAVISNICIELWFSHSIILEGKKKSKIEI